MVQPAQSKIELQLDSLTEATNQDTGILADLTCPKPMAMPSSCGWEGPTALARIDSIISVKMDSHGIFRYAVKTVPVVVKKNLDTAIFGRFFQVCRVGVMPPGI